MPLSQNKKQESQSIEDLIAQLDAPNAALQQAETSSATSSNGSSRTINANNGNLSNGETAQHGDRKMLKGKRTLSAQQQTTAVPTSPQRHHSESGGSNHGGTSPTMKQVNSFGQNSEPVLSRNIISSKKYIKSSRILRGAAKKGGAGGKGTWGAPGCELTEEEFIDSRDPNYDSEEFERDNVVMVCVENQQPAKELTVDDLENGEIKQVALEYFQNGDTMEAIDQLKCFGLSKSAARTQLLAYLIQLALENNNTCKELTLPCCAISTTNCLIRMTLSMALTCC